MWMACELLSPTKHAKNIQYDDVCNAKMRDLNSIKSCRKYFHTLELCSKNFLISVNRFSFCSSTFKMNGKVVAIFFQRLANLQCLNQRQYTNSRAHHALWNTLKSERISSFAFNILLFWKCNCGWSNVRNRELHALSSRKTNGGTVAGQFGWQCRNTYR